MGLFIRNEDSRSELQSRIAAELQERLREQPSLKAEKVEPAFNENQHNTKPAGIVVLIMVVLLIVAIAIAVS